MDFLQFLRYFTPQAELEEAFIYVIHKPIDFSIDFSCRKDMWQPSTPSTENHLLSLSELADRK